MIFEQVNDARFSPPAAVCCRVHEATGAFYFLQRRCRATKNHDGGDCFFVPLRIVLFSSSIDLRDRTYTRFCVVSCLKERHEVGLRLHHPLPRPSSRKAETPPSPPLHRDHDRVSP
ncbi:unnamed protein product, partial [Ectocarpus sp. 4 AP-2014]